MEHTIYIHYEGSISEHTIVFENCPFYSGTSDKLIEDIIDATHLDKCVNKAYKDENLVAIKKLLDNSQYEISNLLAGLMERKYGQLDSNNVRKFDLAILTHPNFKFDTSDISVHNRPFFLKYAKYYKLSKEDVHFMIKYDKHLLTQKLNEMISHRFPYDENIITTILNYGYKYGDLHEIMENYKDVGSDVLQDYLSTNSLEEESDEDDIIKRPKKNYYIKSNRVYFKTFTYYRNGHVLLDPIVIRTDKPTIKLFKKLNLSHALRATSFNKIISMCITSGDLKAIINNIGNNKEKWAILSRAMANFKFRCNYIEKHKKELLYITTHDLFRVTPDMYNIKSNTMDEIKLKTDRSMIVHYLLGETNVNVLGYLIYDLLYDTLKNPKYWKASYSYLTKVNEYRDIIVDRVDPNDFIMELYADEDIGEHDVNYLYNVLSILSIEYYKLDNKLDGITTLKQYCERVQTLDEDMEDDMPQKYLFECALNL